MDPSENLAKKTTAAMRSNSASFPSASASHQQPVIFDDSMKRSVSWPGPTAEKTSIQSFDDMSDLDSYAGNILNTKFNQQVTCQNIDVLLPPISSYHTAPLPLL